MSKYEVVKKIMENNYINEDDKLYFIEMFLKGRRTEKEIKWLWE